MEPSPEHRWLDQLIGEWRCESEAVMAPGAEPMKFGGTESVHSLGGLWVLCEGRCERPGGDVGTTVMTLGFDPARGRFVGTFVASMMTHLWLYEGGLDSGLKVLTVDTEGPDLTDGGAMKHYQDIVTIEDGDHRTLASRNGAPGLQFPSFMSRSWELQARHRSPPGPG